jgi:hypothetical protein
MKIIIGLFLLSLIEFILVITSLKFAVDPNLIRKEVLTQCDGNGGVYSVLIGISESVLGYWGRGTASKNTFVGLVDVKDIDIEFTLAANFNSGGEAEIRLIPVAKIELLNEEGDSVAYA